MTRQSEGYEPRWDIDRARGAKAEAWASDIIEALKSGSVEVKYDAVQQDTGNIYVELECRRKGYYKPSGLSTSESDLWFFVLHQETTCLVVKRQVLIEITDELLHRDHKRYSAECLAGDHPTRGVAVPVALLLRFTHQLDHDERIRLKLWTTYPRCEVCNRPMVAGQKNTHYACKPPQGSR